MRCSGSASYDVIIVGGGHGGAQAAISLRQHGFQGSMAIVSSEDGPPYQRPPLSKAYLADTVSIERILIRPEGFWAENRVDVIGGRRVMTVHAERHTVSTDHGETLRYHTLIWAAGSVARTLDVPGADLRGVHTVRTRTDVDRLRMDLADAARVVVVGGGYIGLEAAAVLTRLGKHVSLIEPLDRVLARMSAEPVSRFLEARHQAHGVDIRLGRKVVCLTGDGGRVAEVRLDDTTTVPCDVAIIGIGGSPVVAPLADAGAATSNGLLVDEIGATSLPGIVAVGDCAAAPSRFANGATVRLESVQNAIDQAVTAARHLTGAAQSAPAPPTFWSDQYDIKLRTVGLSQGHDHAELRGDPRTGKFSVIYLQDRRVIAIDTVNSMKDFAQGRALVQAGLRVGLADLGDASRPLAELVASALTTPESQPQEQLCLHT
jgi:3-phenylpropionate/trans-cinnamate dioxygenase ferredoxin reductase subunit